MAGRAHAPLAAGKGNKEFMSAAWTPYSCESFVNIAALKVLGNGVPDHGAPKAIFLLISLWIKTLKFVIILIDKLIKRRFSRFARLIKFTLEALACQSHDGIPILLAYYKWLIYIMAR